MRKNILLSSILLSFLIIPEMGAQHMKVMPDGVIIPKGDHTAIVLEENGQMVYDTVTKSVWYFNNTVWKEVGSDNLGNHTATESLDMANNPIENLSDPTNDSDAANKMYVDMHEDLDADTLNEIQTISASVEGDTLYLSSSNWLIVPGISDANYIKDFNGNVYTEVTIGGQVWLKENLSTTHYNDGTPIPEITANADWDDWNASWNGTEYTDLYDAYCWYNNDSTTYSKFGILYNWGVVDSTINGGKNACPVGYVVPTMSELEDLIIANGGNLAGLNMKYPVGEYWQHSPNFPFGGAGTNSFGFSAVGSGERFTNGPFDNNKEQNWLWSRTGGTMNNIFAIRLRYDDWEADELSNRSGSEGYSIRCIKQN